MSHRARLFGLVAWVLAASAHALEPTSSPGELVRVADLIADVVEDLRYATDQNFLGQRVYPQGARCWLRRDAALRLVRAAQALRAQGYRLRVYDCYRPRAVQYQMWKLFPRPGYVADPAKGSHHNRGAAVDLTLATADGEEAEMPTGFDTFSRAAHHGSPNASAMAVRHRELLREAMEAAGFRKNRMEWWHYELPGAGRLPLLDAPLADPEPAPDAGVRDHR
jgi:zinc D-Ala-D-Ala dipeptidase